ncbi:MAG: hypothetical protein EBR82_30290 [Caulobacteraceae bacterium]|nr:hypothetical protein [Caulobacteraceae bacterium]
MSSSNRIKLARNTNRMHPMLDLAVNKLMKQNSTFTFESAGSTIEYGGEIVTNGFDIFDGVDFIGTIEYANHNGKTNSEGQSDPAFGIGSPNVNKRRGNRNKIITTDLNAAVRHAKRLMCKPSVDKILNETIDKLYRRIDTLTDQAEREMQRCVRMREQELAIWFSEVLTFENNKVVGLEKLTFADIPKSMNFQISEELFSTANVFKARRKIKNEIPNALGDGSAAFAIRLRNGGIRLFETILQKEGEKIPDGTSLIPVIRFAYSNITKHNVCANMTDFANLEDAPDWVKEKIATLTLAETDHAIPNIGVKVQSSDDSYLFFIYRKQFVENETSEDTATV